MITCFFPVVALVWVLRGALFVGATTVQGNAARNA